MNRETSDLHVFDSRAGANDTSRGQRSRHGADFICVSRAFDPCKRVSDFVASCVYRVDAHNSGEKVCRSTRANVAGVLPSSINHFSLPAKQCAAVVRDEARLKHRPLFTRVKSTHTHTHTHVAFQSMATH